LGWGPDSSSSIQANYISKDALIPGAAAGISFTTLTIDTPKYLNYLLSRFLASGGTVARGTVQHINQVIEGGATALSGSGKPSHADAVVVCAGLGARMLGGVEDKGMYPIRGQTVLLKAPWIKYGRTMVEKDGSRTYTIPRRCGDVRVNSFLVDGQGMLISK
jgi:D-amino-acid oxidase